MRKIPLLTIATCLAVMMIGPTAASAENADRKSADTDPVADIPFSNSLPPDAITAGLDPQYQTGVPAEVRDFVSEHQERIDTSIWRGGTLTLYTSSEVSSLQTAGEAQIGDIPMQVLPAIHSHSDIGAAIRAITERRHLGFGSKAFVAEAVPSEDGGYIDVGIAGLSSETPARSLLPSSVLGIPLKVSAIDAPTPALRNRSTSPVFSGQYMQNATNACSTGFWIGKSSGERALLSADHCGGTVGQKWYYGGGMDSSRILGTAQGQAPGGTDLELFKTSTPSLASGYIFTGSHSNSNAVSPLRGRYKADIIGDSVCYSGSRSGLVCQNTVTSYAGSVCYSASMCYYNVTRTTQAQGTPAVGNGDSGGPVVTVLPGGHVYATGIISGISNGTATCTGDPGGSGANDRKCSSKAIFAPLEAYFDNTSGWGLMYVPQ